MALNIFSVLGISLALASGSWAADDGSTLQPRKTHTARDNLTVAPDVPIGRVVVKFHDGSGVSAAAGKVAVHTATHQGKRLASRGISKAQVSADAIRAQTLVGAMGLDVAPLIGGELSKAVDRRKQLEQQLRRELPDMTTYLSATNLAGLSRADLGWLIDELNQLPSVEIAYLEPVAVPAMFDEIIPPPPPSNSCKNLRVPRGLGDLTAFQGYHGPPPEGIGVAEARFYPGGYGEGVRVIDIEGGYNKHADLPDLFQVIGHATYYKDHGTAVLGVLGAQDNGWGMTGIVPEASIGLRGIVNNNLHGGWSDAMEAPNNVAWHIYWAGMHSLNGVVLIELQRSAPEEVDCPCSTNCALAPVEFWPADFDAIVSAVANGATVIEAAGNGGRSLDHPVLGGAFAQDSGAIMVSGSLDDGVTPDCPIGGQAPNFGSRIDVHSWSENVATTGHSFSNNVFNAAGECFDYRYFNGTSSASAIVAGAATLLNAVYREEHGQAPDPGVLRQIMIDTGSPPLPGPMVEQWIGTHPDLGAAIQAILDL